MEKPSGLKECPRCGLRNRPGAYQCEFCGWDFGVASDDWMGQIDDLEQLGNDIGTPAVDEDIATKIESTIMRPADAVRERPPVDKEISLLEELDLGDAAVAEPVYEAIATEEALAESIPDPYVVSKPEAKAKAKPAAVAKGKPKIVSASKSKFELPLAIGAAITVAGVAALAAALLLVTGGSLDKPVGWAITVVGSFLTVFGVSRLLPSMGKLVPPGKKKTGAEEQK